MPVTLKTLINTNELNMLTAKSGVIVLDCRFYLMDQGKGKSEYDKGHVPGAIFVDVHHELAAPESELTGRHPLPDAADFSNQLQLWGIEPDSQVIVYDDMGGAIAARAWWMLIQQGIDVRVLNGGFPAWLKADLPISLVAESAKPVDYQFDVVFSWVVGEQAIVENFETNQFKLVDSRAPDRFHGENESLDPVAGHIPGAINRPFSDNLDAAGCFKPAEQLHVEWQDWLSGESDDYVYYCGSGITACHNVLALNYAGIEANQVYVGSWSQWAKRMVRAASL